MKKSITSGFLVLVQFVCIGIIVYQNSFPRIIGLPMFIGLLSLIIGVSAIFSMRKSKFTASPVPRKESILIEDGIYKWIRHPMYLAVLLLCLSFIWLTFTWLNIIVYCILLIDLLIKLHWEEKLLSEKFEDYRNYQQRTKKLIPFIF